LDRSVLPPIAGHATNHLAAEQVNHGKYTHRGILDPKRVSC
jgi:hypothetical protein